MFSLSEFMGCVKQRFTWWYNRKTGRRGTVWESRFTSVIVEEEEWALVFYRAILGGQGAERKREDGAVVRRGVSEKVRVRMTTENERQLTSEILTRRVSHFTKGVLIGSRAFVDGWFEANREICRGRSRTERKRGSRSLGRTVLRGLYALRDPH